MIETNPPGCLFRAPELICDGKVGVFSFKTVSLEESALWHNFAD